MTATKYFRAAHLLRRHNILDAQAKELWKELTAILTSGIGVCYSEWEANGKPCYALEIPLPNYLRLFPDAKPELKQYDYDGKPRAYMQYPTRHVGEDRGLILWVSARTPSVLAEAKAATDTKQEATAAA
jgi:hypothetical protein